jgi:hypothetical protein
MRAETLVCSRCVAMPGLVKIGRSRKEDMVNASTGTTHKRGYVAQQERSSHFCRTEVYVELRD